MPIRSTNLLRVTVGAATVAGLTLLGAGAASAHINPSPSEVPAGGSATVQLLVPHGCDGNPTNKLAVQIPEAIVEASPYVVPGWKAEVTTEALAKPVEDAHGGEITERDAVITWTAEAGQALPDGQRINFGIGFTAPDDEGSTLFFKTIQTCDEGSTDWITENDGKGEEPEHPAPAVAVGPATDDGHGGEGDEAAAEDAQDEGADSAASTPTRLSSDGDGEGDSSKGMAISGLVVGLAGVGIGCAAFAKARKA